jgi:hypothetical protein
MIFNVDDRAWLGKDIQVIVRFVDYSLASAFIFNTLSRSMHWVSVYNLTYRELE